MPHRPGDVDAGGGRTGGRERNAGHALPDDARRGTDSYRREATVFRRGGRLYVFLITSGANDHEHRDQARKSVESATWAN